MTDPSRGYRIEVTDEGTKFVIPRELTPLSGTYFFLAFVLFLAVLFMVVGGPLGGFQRFAEKEAEFLWKRGQLEKVTESPSGNWSEQSSIKKHVDTVLGGRLAALYSGGLIVAGLCGGIIYIGRRGRRTGTTIEIRDDGIVIDRETFFPKEQLRGRFRTEPMTGKIIGVFGLSPVTIVRVPAEVVQFILADLNSTLHRVWHYEN